MRTLSCHHHDTRDIGVHFIPLQGEGSTKQAAETAAAAEALAAVSKMGEVVVCGRHHVASLWATLERLLGSDDVGNFPSSFVECELN